MDSSDPRWDQLCDEVEKIEDGQVALEFKRDRTLKQMRKMLKKLYEGPVPFHCCHILGALHRTTTQSPQG